MKKLFVIMSILMVAAIMMSACSHKTCPAYRGSVSENVVNE